VGAINVGAYIARKTDNEAVFRVPFWGRVFLGLLALFMGAAVYFYVVLVSPGIHTFGGWANFCLLGIPPLFVFLFLFYGSLPHEMRLDFARGTYEEKVGSSPFVWQRSGSVDDIRSTYVQLLPRTISIYQIGIVWQGRRAPSKLVSALSDGRYRFACSDMAQPAEELAQEVAAHLHVPYDGLLLPKRGLEG